LAAFGKIEKLCSRLALGKNISDRAEELYKRVDESKELKGRKTDALLTACVFIACRQAGNVRTIKELCGVMEIRQRDLTRCVTKIKELKVYKKTRPTKKEAPVLASAALVERYVMLLKLPYPVTAAATDIANNTAKLGFADGKNPGTIASGAIFLAAQLFPDSRDTVTPEKIADVTQMASSTIQGIYREMYKHRERLVPANKVDIAKGLLPYSS